MSSEKTKQIRILHVLTAMNLAGTETLLMNFYRNIDRTMFQFDFAVCTNERCAYDNEIESLGGKIFHYPRYIGYNHLSYEKWWNDFFVGHPEYRIVHGHIGSTAAIYLKIAKKYGCYTIAHSHSTTAKVSVHSILYKIFSYPTRYIADYFFGCSKKALIDRYGKKIADNSQKSKVLNNAIDAKRFVFDLHMRNEIRQEYGARNEEIVIGTIGRLTPQKNPYEIINICEELMNCQIDFTFWWLGDGELKTDVIKRISERGLGKYIKLLGTRNDANKVLQGMDIFLFPSVWEGLGIACVEAQASGLPTFCSDTIPVEACATDLCHFLQLNNTSQWCEEIIKEIAAIKSNEFERKNMYDQIVLSGFDISTVAKELERFYSSI